MEFFLITYLVFAFLLCCFTIDTNDQVLPICLIALGLTLLQMNGYLNINQLVQNLNEVVVISFEYLLLGLVWVITKWYLHTLKWSHNLMKKTVLCSWMVDYNEVNVWKQRNKLIKWFFYWPISMFVTVLQQIWEWCLVGLLGGLLTYLSEMAQQEVSEHVARERDKQPSMPSSDSSEENNSD